MSDIPDDPDDAPAMLSTHDIAQRLAVSEAFIQSLNRVSAADFVRFLEQRRTRAWR